MNKSIKNSKQAIELRELGYALHRGVKDTMGKTWKFGTMPINGAGGHGHFDTIKQIDHYISEVKLIRQIYRDIEEEKND